MKCVQVPCGLVDVDPSLSMRRVDLFSILPYRCKLSYKLAMLKAGRFGMHYRSMINGFGVNLRLIH